MTWDEFIQAEMQKVYFKDLSKFLIEDAKSHTIYPNKADIFNAFNLCPIDKIKCVILGQDPYHSGNAHGLSFSVERNFPIPPSLRNIFKELQNNIGTTPPKHGNLTAWSNQGVFLLNSALTVRAGEPGKHIDIWQPFTDAAISAINALDRPIVFILWGAYARGKKALITNKMHHVIEGAHPSPLSAYNGFFGSKPFYKTNEFLVKNNIEPIDWQIK